MEYKYIKGSSQYFMEQHPQYKLTKGAGDILGLYIPNQDIAYIFMSEILVNARTVWLMTKNTEFHRPKGLMRLGIRLRRLVEYHEYAHHLQHKLNHKVCERVADRYAMLRFHRDYHRAPGFEFDRSRIKPPTLSQKLIVWMMGVMDYIDAKWYDLKLTMGVQ